jgi:hypothetical protein
VENFKEGTRKVAEELGLELLTTVENVPYEEDEVVMETIFGYRLPAKPLRRNVKNENC